MLTEEQTRMMLERVQITKDRVVAISERLTEGRDESDMLGLLGLLKQVIVNDKIIELLITASNTLRSVLEEPEELTGRTINGLLDGLEETIAEQHDLAGMLETQRRKKVRAIR